MGMNNVLLVSFEIGWGPSSEERNDYNRVYTACEESIKLGISAADYWAENTTFYVVRTEEPALEFVSRVWRGAAMRKDKDRLVVLDIDKTTGQAFGAIKDTALFSLLPCITSPEGNDYGRS